MSPKDKPYALNSFRPFRRKSKDVFDPSQTQNSPRQPQNLIANLRSELGNLKQEVAKLSKKESKHRQNDLIVETNNRNSIQKKNCIYQTYFDDLRSNSLKNETKESLREDYDKLKIHLKKISEENQSMKIQIVNFLQKQKLFEQQKIESNQRINELNEKYKKQYEAKIHQYEINRQRNQKVRLSEQSDRTVSIQNQLFTHKKQVTDLQTQIKNFSDQNRVLRNKLLTFVDQNQLIEKLKAQNKIFQQNQKNFTQKENDLKGQIEKTNTKLTAMLLDIQSKDKIITGLNDQIKKYLLTIDQGNKKYTQLDRDKVEITQQLMSKISQLEVKAQNLQKQQPVASVRINSISRDMFVQLEAQKQLKQMKEVVKMQEKSIFNQQSDIFYLESELKKMSIFRYLSKDQESIILSDNDELISIGLLKLNQKYRSH